jgi:hypothetical protein
VEDDPERGARAACDGADTVTQADAVVAARARVRALARREQDEGAAGRRDDVGARLGSGALLDEHELAAVEVGAGL